MERDSLDELMDKVIVWVNAESLHLDVLKSFFVRDAKFLHHITDHDSGGARNTRITMDQNFTL